MNWRFIKTCEIPESDFDNTSKDVLSIFKNGMGLTGWSVEGIKRQFNQSTWLGLLKEGNENLGYFLCSIPTQELKGKHLLWIDAVSILKTEQKKGWSEKAINYLIGSLKKYDFGFIGGRSQNPAIFSLLEKSGKGIYIPFDREFNRDEMDYLIENIFEVKNLMRKNN